MRFTCFGINTRALFLWLGFMAMISWRMGDIHVKKVRRQTLYSSASSFGVYDFFSCIRYKDKHKCSNISYAKGYKGVQRNPRVNIFENDELILHVRSLKSKVKCGIKQRRATFPQNICHLTSDI